MSSKSLLKEMEEVQLAIDLIELGARMQVLETETSLSRARLVRLFKEVRGMSPPKGLLPFSTDWFVTWMPNIHSSLFYNIYERLLSDHGHDRMTSFIKAYRLYVKQVDADAEAETVLALTRAWTLVRFFECDLLQLSPCTRCTGNFVTHSHQPAQDFVCGICQPPSRAGKTRKKREQKTPAVSNPLAAEADKMMKKA